jgi:hypothetical protein
MATRSLRTLLALAALAAAGCAGGEEDRVEGSGYRYAVPDGWEDVSDEAQDRPGLELAGVRPDSLVIGETEDDFTTNVNVVRETGLPQGIGASEYAEASIAGLRDPVAAGFPPEVAETIERLNPTRISEPRDAELDGEEAAVWDYDSTQAGREVRVRQVAAVMDRSGYTVTLTVLPARFDEGAEALDEIVESWSWE